MKCNSTDSAPAVLQVPVPTGGRALIASDLRLGALSDARSEAASIELARCLEAWSGPGAVVLAGDTFELWAEPNNTPAKALRSHPRLAAAVAAFAADQDRRVIVLAGNHDGALGWDAVLSSEVRSALGAEVAHAADLEMATGNGVERVRVEHGHQLDPHNAFVDPTRGGDRPLGQHVVVSILPGLRGAGAVEGAERDGWLSDVGGLSDPAAFPRYVASRLVYRRLARHLWWLALPAALLALARLTAHLTGVAPVATVSRLAPLLAISLVAEVGLVALGLAVAGRRVVQGLSSLDVVGTASRADHTAAARARAVQLAAEGYRGYVTGHTHRAELVDLDGTFYASAGSNSEVLDEVAARGGLPPVFRAARCMGWLELEAGSSLHARLWVGQQPVAAATRLERIVARRTTPLPVRPAVVATLGPRRAWPPVAAFDAGRRARRVGAVIVGALGVVNLVSALTPPIGQRLRGLRTFVPLALPETAAIAAVALGVVLLLVASGVRRGQRRAWAIAVGALAGSSLVHVAKGFDVEEAGLALAATVYLLARGRYFRGRTRGTSTRHAFVVLGTTGLGALGIAAVVAAVRHIPFPRVLGGFAGRAVGLRVGTLPAAIRPLSAAVAGACLVSVCGTVWLMLRPNRLGSPTRDASTDGRAWDLVRRHGRGTLDYFALRDDKAHYVWNNTVVAYTVRGGVAVVAPDPIGPPDERSAAWSAFRCHAAGNGWSVAVLGAGEDWLPIYRAAGMTAIYAGDEAVVDVSRFRLEGGRNKALRQAVNRVERAGYRVEFWNPADLEASAVAELRALLCQSRKGDVERGFSMTLSRVFDPRDTDLLLAVAIGPDGHAAAFCQYVPAPGIDGYSLDLMRRGAEGQPNGLTDFVVVRTILELKQRGRRSLGLNFATMRAVLAGDVDDTWLVRRQRWVLRRLGEDMQIESLWRFNAKYDPAWVPRYVVIDGPEQILSAGLALAAAESLWELPLIGRFLRPTAT